MADKGYTASFAAAFAEISPVTLRAWTVNERFKTDAAITRDIAEIHQFIPEEQRVPLPQHTWGRYTADDLLRLHTIATLRKNGWALDDALSVIGQHSLQNLKEPPVEYLAAVRVGEAVRLMKFWKKADLETAIRQSSSYGIATVIYVAQLRKETEDKIAEMEAYDNEVE